MTDKKQPIVTDIKVTPEEMENILEYIKILRGEKDEDEPAN